MKTRQGHLPTGEYLEVEYGIESFPGQDPYFAVGGSIWTSRSVARRRPEDPDVCGMIHADVLRAFPDLADLVALHLSSAVTGAPMHDEANGWHFYQQGQLDTCASHLRVPVENLPLMFGREQFRVYVDSLRPRWAEEARVARAKYELDAGIGEGR